MTTYHAVYERDESGAWLDPVRYRLKYNRSGELYEYDYLERLLNYQDRNGNTIELGYDGSGRVVSVTDTQDRVTTLGYNASGSVETVTDPAGRVHSYGYTGSNLTSYTDPANNTTTCTYAAGEVKVTDAEGNATRFTLDARSRVTAVTRVTNPSTGTGLTTTFDYSVPWRTTVTDPRGNPTVYHFDWAGRVTKTVDALGHERETGYNTNSNVTSYVGETGGTAMSNVYSEDGRYNIESSTSSEGVKSTFDYNPASTNRFSPSKYTNPQGNALTYDYDTPGNLREVTDDLGGATTLVRRTDGAGLVGEPPRD